MKNKKKKFFHKKIDNKKNIPTGVKIIAILYYIGAAAAIILGFLFFFVAFLINSILGPLPYAGTFHNQFPRLGIPLKIMLNYGIKIGGVLFFLVGIIFIFLGILYLFIGRDLWKGRNWARIVAIIFSILGILESIIYMTQFNIFDSIFSFLLNLIIFVYLSFNKKVKKVFT